MFLPNKRDWGFEKDFFDCRHGHQRIKFFNVWPSLCLLEILIKPFLTDADKELANYITKNFHSSMLENANLRNTVLIKGWINGIFKYLLLPEE